MRSAVANAVPILFNGRPGINPPATDQIPQGRARWPHRRAVFWFYTAVTFSAKVNDMSFLTSLRNWAASGVVAGLLLCAAGCSPEASTPSKTTGGKAGEQAGSTTGPAKKGRAEIPEPAPADEGEKKDDAKPADDKPASEKPADEKP